MKTFLRDLLPQRHQVPAKYWYGRLRGGLEGEMEFLPLLIRRGDRAVDVGGNRGVYAYGLWRLGAAVEVFEPHPGCFSVLKSWAVGKPGVRLHPVALSSREGSACLHIPVDEAGVEHDASASIEQTGFTRTREQIVPLQTVDSYGFHGVALVKIDVEGHEYSVIEGAAATIAASKPALLIEIEQRHSSRPIAEVFAKVEGFGYQGFFLERGRLNALERFDPARHQALTSFHRSDGVYVNNFLFLHRSRLAAGEYSALMSPARRHVKVSVVTPLFAIAGVPLAQLRLARALADCGHDVDLVIGRVDPGYRLPEAPGLRIQVLNRLQVRGMLLPLTRYFRRARPDLVFSAEDHLNAAVLLAAIAAGCRAKISCSSRVTPFDTYSGRPFTKPWLLKQLVRFVTWRADALTCVSRDMVDQYRQVFRSPPHVCVYNIVDDRHSRQRMGEAVEHEWFTRKEGPLLVAAGRLAPWKGFSDLVRAMQVLPRHRRARLVILGDGPLRSELEALIIELGVQDIVSLPGYVENPLKYFAKADVFVLSSHVEGLPNVLVEAMMCGCTPVATDCPTGPREVLQEGRYGYLVPMRDPAALARGIEEALDRPIPKELLREAVRPFEEAAVIDRHFEVLGLATPPNGKLL